MPIAPQAVDVVIREGEVAAALPDELRPVRGVLWDGELDYEVGPEVVLLHLYEVGRFLLTGGSSIVVQRDADVTDDSLRLYTLGTCLGIMLIRQGIFPFHGSTVRTPLGTVMFIAPSGWGKSTTAAKFVQEGHALLTDDVCVVRADDSGQFMAYPFSYRLRLWDDSIEALDLDSSQFGPIMPDYDKREQYVQNQLARTAEPLVAIYELWPEDDSALAIEPLDLHHRIATLASNTFREEAVALFDLERPHFDFCSAVARAVPVRRLRRPENTFSIDALYHLVMDDLRQMRSARRESSPVGLGERQ